MDSQLYCLQKRRSLLYIHFFGSFGLTKDSVFNRVSLLIFYIFNLFILLNVVCVHDPLNYFFGSYFCELRPNVPTGSLLISKYTLEVREDAKKVPLLMAGPLRPNPPPPLSLVAVEILERPANKRRIFLWLPWGETENNSLHSLHMWRYSDMGLAAVTWVFPCFQKYIQSEYHTNYFQPLSDLWFEIFFMNVMRGKCIVIHFDTALL